MTDPFLPRQDSGDALRGLSFAIYKSGALETIGSEVTAALPVAPRRSNRLFWASVAANVADYGTTYWALSRGGREGNPVTAIAVDRGPVVFGAYKVAAIAVPELGARWLERRGHRNQAKVCRFAGIVLPGLMAASNTITAVSMAPARPHTSRRAW